MFVLYINVMYSSDVGFYAHYFGKETLYQLKEKTGAHTGN